MSSGAEHRADFPLRGKWCAAPKGVHFQRAKPGLHVLYARRAVVWFSFRGAAYKLHRRQAIPQPSGPQGLSNLRTLWPKGPVKLEDLFPTRPPWYCVPPSPRWEACHTILRSLALPYESCSLANPLKRGDNQGG